MGVILREASVVVHLQSKEQITHSNHLCPKLAILGGMEPIYVQILGRPFKRIGTIRRRGGGHGTNICIDIGTSI